MMLCPFTLSIIDRRKNKTIWLRNVRDTFAVRWSSELKHKFDINWLTVWASGKPEITQIQSVCKNDFLNRI